MGIAQIAIGPPSPHSNGHSVAPIFGQNHVNARLYMVISPKNRCHKPSWQGFRPPAPNGQCPNEQLYFYGGASLNTLCLRLLTDVLTTPYDTIIEICAGAQQFEDGAKEEEKDQVLPEKDQVHLLGKG